MIAATVDWLQHYGLLTPFVQFFLATVFAGLFAEKWQRWRQRRDFQYRTLVKFSELTYELSDTISELLVRREYMRLDTYAERHREMVSRWAIFMSMRGEVMACFGRDFLMTPQYQSLADTLGTLLEYARAPKPIPSARFEPNQEKFLACREAVVADMVYEMGLVSVRDHFAESRTSEMRLREANARALRVETELHETQEP